MGDAPSTSEGTGAAVDGRPSFEEIGRRYVRLFAEPRATEEIRSTVDELVAGDHVAYDTSWGTLLGRTALKEYAEVARAAFPTLSYRIDGLAARDDVVYCRWSADESHRTRRRDAYGIEPPAARRTMTVRIADGLIVETWQPPDPWLPLWSDVAAAPPNRADR